MIMFLRYKSEDNPLSPVNSLPPLKCFKIKVLSVASEGHHGLHLPTCPDPHVWVSSSHRSFAHAVPAVWNFLSSLPPHVNPLVCSSDLHA